MQKNLSNKELVAAGHQFAKNLSSDTPLIDMAKMVSQLATQLDVALVAAGEAVKQRDAMLAENASIKASVEMHAAGFKICPACSHQDECETDDVVWMVREETPVTDALLNAVRAEGVEMFVAFNLQLAERYPMAMVSKSLEVMELNAEQFVIRLRAGTDTTPSQYESLAGGK